MEKITQRDVLDFTEALLLLTQAVDNLSIKISDKILFDDLIGEKLLKPETTKGEKHAGRKTTDI